MSIFKTLQELGGLLRLDCGDNSCHFAGSRYGMRTNGGCTCDPAKAIREQMAQAQRDLEWQAASCKALQVSQEQLALQVVDLQDKLARVKLALMLSASDGVLRADDYGRLYRAVCAAIADPDKEKT